MTKIQNKKAFFDYEITDRFTAGRSLLGAEVKSLRSGRGSFSSAFVSVRNEEAYIKNFQIPRWEFSQQEIDPLRDRKLLLRKREIRKIQKKLDEQGYSVVPLRLFFHNGFAKIEIALGKGKKKHDKRVVIKKRDEERRLAGKIKRY